MRKFINIRLGLTVLFILSHINSLFAIEKNLHMRTIDISGLIVNSQSLLPIESATIRDSKNNILGVTDINGYFLVKISYKDTGAVQFKLIVAKEGYKSFVQSENWGDIQQNTKIIMYFGMRGSHSKSIPFSSLVGSNGDLGYNNVLSKFGSLKLQRDFNEKLEIAKKGNENTFLKVDEKLFIVSSSGWIQVESGKDLILLDSNQLLPVDRVNSTIKRNDIKRMTPVISGKEKLAIFTHYYIFKQ